MDMAGLGAVATAGVENQVVKPLGYADCTYTSWLLVNCNSGWRQLLPVHRPTSVR